MPQTTSDLDSVCALDPYTSRRESEWEKALGVLPEPILVPSLYCTEGCLRPREGMRLARSYTARHGLYHRPPRLKEQSLPLDWPPREKAGTHTQGLVRVPAAQPSPTGAETRPGEPAALSASARPGKLAPGGRPCRCFCSRANPAEATARHVLCPRWLRALFF